MNTEITTITTEAELISMDWEVPNMPIPNGNNTMEIVALFEEFNKVDLQGKAYKIFKEGIPFYYDPNQ